MLIKKNQEKLRWSGNGGRVSTFYKSLFSNSAMLRVRVCVSVSACVGVQLFAHYSTTNGQPQGVAPTMLLFYNKSQPCYGY